MLKPQNEHMHQTRMQERQCSEHRTKLCLLGTGRPICSFIGVLLPGRVLVVAVRSRSGALWQCTSMQYSVTQTPHLAGL